MHDAYLRATILAVTLGFLRKLSVAPRIAKKVYYKGANGLGKKDVDVVMYEGR